MICWVCETEYKEMEEYYKHPNREDGTIPCPKCEAAYFHTELDTFYPGPVVNLDLEKGEVTFKIKRG